MSHTSTRVDPTATESLFSAAFQTAFLASILDVSNMNVAQGPRAGAFRGARPSSSRTSTGSSRSDFFLIFPVAVDLRPQRVSRGPDGELPVVGVGEGADQQQEALIADLVNGWSCPLEQAAERRRDAEETSDYFIPEDAYPTARRPRCLVPFEQTEGAVVRQETQRALLRREPWPATRWATWPR